MASSQGRKRGREPRSPEFVFMMALVVLVAVSIGGFFVFRRVVRSSTRVPGLAVASATSTPGMGPGSGEPMQAPLQPSGRPGSGARQEPILRLRDLVAGTVAVSGKDGLELDPEQKKKLGKLLPRVRTNMEGNAAQIDVELEKQYADVLRVPQRKAISEWRGQQKLEPDYVKELKTLEQMCGSDS